MSTAQLRVTTKSLPEHNRQRNRSLLLQLLLHADALSRADLARQSGLTRATVSDVIAELTADGLIVQYGQRADVRIGKPAQLIGLDDHAHHVISLDLSADDVFVGAITTLRGEIVHRISVPLADAQGDDAVEIAATILRDLVRRSTVRILGVGVASPGIIDRTGLILHAPNLGWHALDLGARLKRIVDVPVHVANDANAAALAVHTEHRFTGQSLLTIAIEHGVGAGLILGDSLIEGDQFSAGEIGHVIVDDDGEQCACGRRGCLEMAIAVPQLRRRLAETPDDRDRVLAEAGRSLGVALAPVVATLNLNMIVLAGPADLLEGAFCDAALATIRTRTLPDVSSSLQMTIAEHPDDLALRGATALVLAAELRIS